MTTEESDQKLRDVIYGHPLTKQRAYTELESGPGMVKKAKRVLCQNDPPP